MQKRHDELLTNRLEQAADEGHSFILWSELYRWYDVKKIAAGSRRDLSQRWEELTEGTQGPLEYVEANCGMHIFGRASIKMVYEE
nr:hypothetical protein [Dyella sp. ASV24]